MTKKPETVKEEDLNMIRKGSFYEKVFNFILWIDPTSPRSLWKKINEKK